MSFKSVILKKNRLKCCNVDILWNIIEIMRKWENNEYQNVYFLPYKVWTNIRENFTLYVRAVTINIVKY